MSKLLENGGRRGEVGLKILKTSGRQCGINQAFGLNEFCEVSTKMFTNENCVSSTVAYKLGILHRTGLRTLHSKL